MSAGRQVLKGRTSASDGHPSQAALGLVGLTHQTASIAIRSRVAMEPEAIRAFLREASFTECAVLSTCNRTEIYFAGGAASVARSLLARQAGMTEAELGPSLFDEAGEGVARHLFHVAAGLESAVLGETEIVAQVKEAWRIAEAEGTAGSVLTPLFRRALEASKRVRTETDLCRNVTSTASLAVRMAAARLGSLADRRVLLVGAGKIAERIAKELSGGDVRILNRTRSRAEALAERWGGSVCEFESLEAELTAADVVFSTLGSAHPLLSAALLGRVVAARGERFLMIVDMGVPPNVEDAEPRPGLEVVHLDALVTEGARNSARRATALPAALELLDEELAKYQAAVSERAAAPTIQALVRQSEEIRDRNVEWARERLAHLTPKELRVVEEMARRMTNGFLSAPIDGLKGELSSAEHQAVVARLFGIQTLE